MESDPNDDDWEHDLEGTDDSDVENVIDRTTQNIPTEGPTKDERLRTLLFSPTTSSDYIPSSAPATGVDEEENESNNKNHDLGTKVAAENAEKLSKPKEKSSKLTAGIGNVKAVKNFDTMKIREKIQKGNSGNISPMKRNEKIEAARSRNKKREDETKLNKFLSKAEKKENEKLQGKVLSSDHTDTSLEANSSQNPPPYIRKHKVGKSEEARASELDDIYFLCEYRTPQFFYFSKSNFPNAVPNISFPR